MNTKQVLVIRKDLQMRRGKEISQGAGTTIIYSGRGEEDLCL
jgi:peptidyl-tRNA hydrolase